MPVFFVCAGLLGLLAAILTLNIGRLRGKKKINLGDGGDPEMQAAVRAHANLIEFVPLCLLLIYVASDFYGFPAISCATFRIGSLEKTSSSPAGHRPRTIPC